MPTPCPLSFPSHWPQNSRDVFCDLWRTKSHPFNPPYTVVDPQIVRPIQDGTSTPLAYAMDLTRYLYHPTEIYVGGLFFGTINTFKEGKMVGIKRVESVGNGDQGATIADQTQFGNLYFLTWAGPCASDRSYHVSAMRNFRDIPDADNFLSYLVGLSAIQKDRGMDFMRPAPTTVKEAKETLPAVIVTVLPGPYGTHAPDDPESIKKGYTMKQGEFGLAWQSVTYTMGKPVGKSNIPLGDPNLPAPLRSATQFCSKVMQSHGRQNELMQFTWTPAEVMRRGGLTVAHDIHNYYAVLREAAAKTTPSLLKITLGQ